jgi:hypothetical protein
VFEKRAHANASYLIRNADKLPWARLYANIQPAINRVTSERLLQFTLTARGKPDGDNLDSALEWLDRGRVAVVKAFTSLTRAEMHRRWGRKDAQ